MQYKYNKNAGALNEAAPAVRTRAAAPPGRAPALAQAPSSSIFDGDDYVGAHATNVTGLAVAAAPTHAQMQMQMQMVPRGSHGVPPAAKPESSYDPITLHGDRGMFFYTVQDGQRVYSRCEHLGDGIRGERSIKPSIQGRRVSALIDPFALLLGGHQPSAREQARQSLASACHHTFCEARLVTFCEALLVRHGERTAGILLGHLGALVDFPFGVDPPLTPTRALFCISRDFVTPLAG